MSTKRLLFGTVCAALLLAFTTITPANAQQAMQGKTAEQVYKNIKVLKGTPAEQLNLAMHLVGGELGVDCTFCHVDHDPTHFQLDDNPKKDTARQMMQMMIDINNNSFKGKQVVTCYTCHQGKPDPVGTLMLPLAHLYGEEEPLSRRFLPPIRLFPNTYKRLAANRPFARSARA